MSYAEDLKHPMWQERRLRVFERAGFMCIRCKSQDNQLHAHHKVYIRGHRLWEYEDEMLECLCERCHRKAHDQKDELDQIVAVHSSAALPVLSKLVAKLSDVLRSVDRNERVAALNRLQDELDLVADYARGPGGCTQ